MQEIYSEEDLEVPWGQWKFALSSEEIASKLSSLPEAHFEENEDFHWVKLLSLVQENTSYNDNVKLLDTKEDSFHPMECSPIIVSDEIQSVENIVDEEMPSEELAICLVDLCNQVAPKLRNGLSSAKEEMQSFVQDISKLEDNSLISVMSSAWSQLSSDANKICFCVPFTSNSRMCKKLCENILLPWLGKKLPSKIELLSEILSEGGDIVIIHLVAPLLRIEDSPLVQDTINLEELMASMADKQWSVLMRELLLDLRELLKWQIPVLATVVEHSKPSFDELHVIVQIMSSTGTTFAQSRDFGSLLVAVAKHLGDDMSSLVTQLKLIVNNYKGPLKFKLNKLLEDFED